MRRNIRKEFVVTEEEAADLKRKAQAVRMPESQLIRHLISGYRPPEAPGKEFFGAMNRLAEQVDKLEKLSHEVMDTQTKNLLFDESMNLKEFRLKLFRKYVVGKEE